MIVGPKALHVLALDVGEEFRLFPDGLGTLFKIKEVDERVLIRRGRGDYLTIAEFWAQYGPYVYPTDPDRIRGDQHDKDGIR